MKIPLLFRSSLRSLFLTATLFAFAAGSSAQSTNIVLAKPFTVDSRDTAWRDGDKALDGNSDIGSGRWVSENVPFPHWIEVETGDSFVIDQIKFWTGNSDSYGAAISDFQLQYWDGWDWIDIMPAVTANLDDTVDIAFTPSQAGERIRFLATEGLVDNYAKLYELEVYGAPAPISMVTRSPLPGSRIVDVDQPIVMEFSQPVELANSSLLRYRNPADNNAIGTFSATVSATASGSLLTLQPDQSMPYGQSIEVVVPDGTLQLAGDPSTLNQTFIWEFETLPETPQILAHPREATDLAAPVVISYDRSLSLVDSGKISISAISSGLALPGTTVSVTDNDIVINHAGLDDGDSYLVEILPGAVADALSGTTVANRFAFVVYGGAITLWESDFEQGPDGLGTTGRWEWANRSILDGSLGSMESGSSDPRKYMYTPQLSLDSSSQYQFNFRFLWRNPGAAGLMPYLPDSSSSDWQNSPDWKLLRVGSGSATFSPSVTGDYHILVTNHLPSVGNQYQSSTMDNLSLKKAVAPAVRVASPVAGAVFNEGDVVPVRFDAAGLAGEIVEVSLYDPLDERILATWDGPRPEGYSFDWAYYTTPGYRELELVVRDSTQLESKVTIPVTINLPDGSLPTLVHYDFDRSSEGFTGNIRRDVNDFGPGSDGLRPSGDPVYFASPVLFLLPGQTYTVSFDYKIPRTTGYYIYGFLSSPTATFSETLPEDQLFQLDEREWTSVSHSFTVPESGPYHLMFFEKQRVGTTQSDVLFDNIRLSGNFNSAPAVSLISPPNGINAIVGSTLSLEATASDLDGHVEEVRFMRGNRILYTATEAPYQFDYEIPVSGEITLHAVAVDNNLGFTNSNPVTVHSDANNLSHATYLGNLSDEESFYQVAYQSDGTLLVAGMLDPDLFPGVSPLYLNGTAPGDRGLVARLSEDGQQVLSVTVVAPTVVTDMSLDGADTIYLALHSDGAVALDSTASAVVWSHDWASHSHRIDAGPNGTVAVLTAPRSDWESKQLADAQVRLVDATGAHVTTLSGGGRFTTDLAIHEPSSSVIMVAFKNINTDSNPVDIPQMMARDFSNNIVWRAYDWGGNPGTAPNPMDFSDGSLTFDSAYPSWDPLYEFSRPVIDTANADPPSVEDLRSLGGDSTLNSYTNGSGQGYLDAYIEWHAVWTRWLNRPTNNMADTRGARVLIGPDGLLYAAFEYDGGNSPLRFDPFSLDQEVTIVGGDLHHEMSFTSTVPKVFIGRYEPTTGDYYRGQWITNRLDDGRDNTIRLDQHDFAVDSLGRVHIAGSSGAGITATHDFIPGAYDGGAYYLVYSPDFTNREMWTRFSTGGDFHGVAISPNGIVALGGKTTNNSLYTSAAWQTAIASDQDAMLVVGNMEPYFEFHVGEHPRLFFSAEDIPELRSRLNEEPYQSIHQRMLDALDVGSFGDVYDPSKIYDRTTRAQLLAFLYTLTGNEDYAAEAREHVEAAFVNTEHPWADPSSKGLGLYWIGTRVAVCYDLLVHSESWDSAFDYAVSKKLYDMARVVIEQGGSEQNSSTGSNWQGARGGAGALMALAMDHNDDRGLVDAGWNRVVNYVNAAYGGSGWLGEGTGYFYFPVANYIGPMGIAMARHDPSRDLRSVGSFAEGFWAAIASNVSNTNPFGWGGIQSDWSDDSSHLGGEGVYGLAFHYLPEALQDPYQFAYDHHQGARSPADDPYGYNPVWDSYRAGSIWSYLLYPRDGRPFQPAESYAWHDRYDDADGLGIFTFRDRFLNGEDTVAQMKLRLGYLETGHDAPDGLGFRINAGGAPFTIGGGRNSPARKIGQASVYPVNPSDGSSVTANANTGNLIGTPLITHRGDGHIIGQMDVNNVNTSNHKRWFVANYDAAATGADAAFLIADTSANGKFWHFNTYVTNEVSIDGNTFTITAENGAILKGTLLYPTSGYTITTGTKDYGSELGNLNGGRVSDRDPVTNPAIQTAKYLQIEQAGGDFLVAMTVQKPGNPAHPVVSLDSGTVPDAVVSIGSMEIALQQEDVHYNGSPYTYPDATVTFSPGSEGQITAGNPVQTVAYSNPAVAPTITPDDGWIFTGWDKPFDPVLTDMVVTATYAALETIPTDPDLLAATPLSASAIALSWRDRSIGETGFTIEVSPDGINWSPLDSTGPEVTTYSHTGLAPESTRYYRVKATGTDGDSAFTEVASATTDAPNTSPVFDNGGLSAANENQLYFHTLFASDPEEDPLTFTAVSLPAWLSLSDFGDGTADLVGTPGSADTGSHSVTVAVSDGVNPSVELTYSIEVNAAPVITLVSPAQQPALVPSGQGIKAEVATADSLAVTTTWAFIAGPGNLTFDESSGLINGILPTADGLYTVRVTATDSAGASAFLDFQIEWDGTGVSYETAALLDFGSPDQSIGDFRNQSASTITGQDWDGDGPDDLAKYWAFRSDVPLSKGTYPSPDSRNFYGGIVSQGIDGEPSLSNAEILNDTPKDRINMRVQYTGGQRLAAAFFWDIEDFSSLPANATVALGADAVLSIPDGFDRFSGNSRWLIRNGSQFYVSETAISNNLVGKELSGSALADTMWAAYSPVEDSWQMQFDFNSATYDKPTSEMENITAVGLLIDRQTFDTFRVWYDFNSFHFTGMVAAPVNFAPIIDMGAPLMVEPSTTVATGASVSDDGLPSGSTTTYAWSVVSGPASGVFSDATDPNSTFSESVEGEYTLRLTADDGGIRTFAEKTVTIAAASDPLLTWLQGYPAIPTSDHSPDADFDGDGLNHLIEYAFGLSPVVSSILPTWISTTDGSTAVFAVDLASQRADITYEVEISSDLSGWTTLAHASNGMPMEAAAGLPENSAIEYSGSVLSLVMPVDLQNDSDQYFFRIKLTR